jgi:hypothetical protein
MRIPGDPDRIIGSVRRDPIPTSAIASAADEAEDLFIPTGSRRRTLFGLIHWTDNPEDRKAECGQFAKKYDEMHRLVKESDGEATLYVGVENWPLPIPLVQKNGAWYFETSLRDLA